MKSTNKGLSTSL